MHQTKRHSVAQIWRTMRPTRGDGAVTMIGLAPLLMAAKAANEAPGYIELAIATAIAAAAGMLSKAAIVSIAAALRAYRKQTRATPQTADDMIGEVVGAAGDALDPEHSEPHPIAPSTSVPAPALPPSEKGPPA